MGYSFLKYFIIFIITTFPFKVYSSEKEIVILSSKEIEPYEEVIKGFRNSCKSFKITQYNIKGDLERGNAIITIIKNQNPSLLFLIGPHALKAAIDNNITFPKLYTMVLNPEKFGDAIINIPGITLNIPIQFQLNTILSFFKSVKKIGILYDPNKNSLFIEEIKKNSDSLNCEIIPIEINSGKELPQKFKEKLSKIDIILMIPDTTVITKGNIDFIMANAILNHIPVVGFNRSFLEQGAILAFSIDYYDVGVHSAEIASKILKGENITLHYPPRKISTCINLKIAQKIGISIEEEILKRADEVIR